MSVSPPVLTVALDSVGVPQADVIDALVHLGATKEVSSWELRLQNWNSKYSPNGTYPLNVGQDGYICIGRDANVPQLITTRTESIKYQSSPTENYVIVGGRCWGEKLFRQTVTKDYSDFKGEAIVKDLLDYYSGISHVRGSTELVEDTDTTFTDLKVQDTQVWDLLQKIASESDKNGVIGYDFRTAPDGKFEFFPRGTKTSPVSLIDKIEYCEYSKDIFSIRNKVTIKGAADKSAPPNKVDWTQNLNPTGCTWVASTGSVSIDVTGAPDGSPAIMLTVDSNYAGIVDLNFSEGYEPDMEAYPLITVQLKVDTTYSNTGFLLIEDTEGRFASKTLSIAPDDTWHSFQTGAGSGHEEEWERVDAGFNWGAILKIRFSIGFPDIGSGSFMVHQLYVGGRRYSATVEDTASQHLYTQDQPREYVDTDEELWSDNECLLRARAILANRKDPSEYINARSTVIDYGSTPLFAADMIEVSLPNEGVNGSFRVLNAEYHVKSETGELEITLELGREKSLLADYVYALRSKVDHVNRYKVAKK